MPIDANENNTKSNEPQSVKSLSWMDVLNRWLDHISKVMNCEQQSKYK